MDAGLSSAYRAINGGSTRSFAVYLLASSSAATAFFLSGSAFAFSRHSLALSLCTSRLSRSLCRVHSRCQREQDMELSRRSALATVVGFLGSAFGGVGGGGIFVPMLNLVVGFDAKSAAALSKCMIMGASASSVSYNLRVVHPSKFQGNPDHRQRTASPFCSSPCLC